MMTYQLWPSYLDALSIQQYVHLISCTDKVNLLSQTMDISKMTAGDASFTAPFKLVAERDDYIHALVAYFDVSFTKCHKLMGFSTGSVFSFTCLVS